MKVVRFAVGVVIGISLGLAVLWLGISLGLGPRWTWVFLASLFVLTALGWLALYLIARASIREAEMNYAAIVDGCRRRSTEYLVRTHDEGVRYANSGSPATLGGTTLEAVREVLAERGVALCHCGAPDGGVHTMACEVS
ncbi:hypothetical protein C1I98_11015 [Spongiactinospora gelatinilytica]|uniref:Uncharacterized protein n=1 Tax=Spongiactinospora gelatinilytica TaxID=2666298 RepID=A0A2W2H4R1_9ACTN|nr:hypothetical protein [Spongiactinospora gelatinilytica]PZG49839.1 hypothetical protein C1I98_11015 [Spongiactinospora gelatinilytica]